MAKRIGKYKISKREAELSAIDGGTISGNLDGIGTLGTSGNITTSGNVVISDAVDGLIHTNSGTITQATNHTTGVTINATSGVITLAAVALNAGVNAEFTVTNSTVQADSVILVTVQDENTTNNTSIVATTHTIGAGSFKINLQNPQSSGNTSATASKVHFLVINNS